MNRIAVLLACVYVGISFSKLSAQPVVSDLAADALFREAVSQLGDVKLSAEQLAQIKKLADQAAPQIRDAELLAQESETQRQARQEATAQAVKNGLRGAAARKLVMGANSRTAEQRSAFQRAAKIRREFDHAVYELLTKEQRVASLQPAQRVKTQRGFLVVQLSPDLPLPPATVKTLDEAAAKLNLPNLRAVIQRYRLTKSERVANPALLDRIENISNQAAAAEIKLLRTYWRIDIRGLESGDEKTISTALTDLPEVDEVYVASELYEPSPWGGVNSADDPKFPLQRYLGFARSGIDAAAAWGVAGGQGAGVGLVDLEMGWNIDHEDLRGLLREPIYGDRQPGKDHGTSVVGQVAAHDNTVGIVGAAPSIDYLALSSIYHYGQPVDSDVVDSVLTALFIMDPGDVLLIELQAGGYPVEVDTVNYLVIRIAALMGMIVIEPTGNGNVDLDDYVSVSSGKHILNRDSPDFRDSGAIMVGASDPSFNHNKARASCYGSRVDCFGWGNEVVTTGCGPLADCIDNGGGDPNKTYRSMFCGTSSAAPMIAGAALLVQGLYKARNSIALSPWQMRLILSDPLTGTPQGPDVDGDIGVMPNLKAIIATWSLESCSSGICTHRHRRPRHCRVDRRAFAHRRR